MNSMVLFDIFNNVYKCRFDMMAKSNTSILFNVVTLNLKHWVFLQKKMSFGPLDPFIGFMTLETRLKKRKKIS
jgi:hypothetical protein